MISYRKRGSAADLFGIGLSIAVNLGIVALCACDGLQYLDPPPEEKTLLINVEEMMAEQPETEYGTEASAPEDPQEEIELVRQSEAPLEGTRQNLAETATVGTDGDAEVPEPPREEVIDKRALFPADRDDGKDTLAAQTARKAADAMSAGHALGNSDNGPVEGRPGVRIQGRKLVGGLRKPAYNSQSEGIVVVEIWVDRQGSVTEAYPGAEGTTVTDRKLWNDARIAALETKFNVDPEADERQKGSITYIFRLK